MNQKLFHSTSWKTTGTDQFIFLHENQTLLWNNNDHILKWKRFSQRGWLILFFFGTTKIRFASAFERFSYTFHLRQILNVDAQEVCVRVFVVMLEHFVDVWSEN